MKIVYYKYTGYTTALGGSRGCELGERAGYDWQRDRLFATDREIGCSRPAERSVVRSLLISSSVAEASD